jgi:hypothetical protein
MRVSFVRGTETGLKRRRMCRTSMRTRMRLSFGPLLSIPTLFREGLLRCVSVLGGACAGRF